MDYETPKRPDEENIHNVLVDLGIADKPHTKDTPRRVMSYLREFCVPYSVADVLGEPFLSEGTNSLISQGPIAFRGLCAHHLAPMLGHAYVGYIPNDFIVGLSKMARLVQAVGTAEPGLQEHMCDLIADEFNHHVRPKGVIVFIRSIHTCMSARGISMPDVYTSTSSVRGLFLTVPSAREEFFHTIRDR